MKIYTGKGDDGTTGMLYGGRVSKNAPLIQVIGEIDELNCYIGLLLAEIGKVKSGEMSFQVQQYLFSIGSQMAQMGDPKMEKEAVELKWIKDLEHEIDQLTDSVPPLQNFILPGGSKSVALAHLCRSVCRRVERTLVSLNNEGNLQLTLKYINRLSDYYFSLARKLAKEEGVEEVIWKL